MEKLLPQSVEAEKGVLGSIIIDPEAYDLVADKITPEDFYRDTHRIIYETILSLAKRRVSADFITLCDELDRVGKLDVVGGAFYLTGLINDVPTSGNIEYYADIVARTAIHRRLIHAAGQIAALAYEQSAQALNQSIQLLFNLEQHTMSQAFSGMPGLVTEYMEELDFLHDHKGALTGVPTGYNDIDDPTGGFQKSDFIILGGRPSSGKTSLGLCMGYNAAIRGRHVAIFSLEMGKKQLMRRLMSMATKVDLQRLRSGWIEEDEWERIVNEAGNLAQLPIWINDTAGNPIASMRSQLRRLVQEQGYIDLVIIDYLGLIEPDEKSENRVQEMSKISRGIKQLAREFDTPILALAQLSRNVESRQNKRPMLADLRDSGSLEQDADVVLFVYRDAYYAQQEGREVAEDKKNIADISLAKQRNGPTGDIQLYFQPEQAMFYPLEECLKPEESRAK